MAGLKHPVTPDGRYFVVRGKLWRMANPNLSPPTRSVLVSALMKARSAVRSAKLAGDPVAEAAAHRAVDIVKRELGERGPVWWTDGSPDLNGRLVTNTPYAAWFSSARAAARTLRHVSLLDANLPTSAAAACLSGQSLSCRPDVVALNFCGDMAETQTTGRH
jgi:hypothetical protein